MVTGTFRSFVRWGPALVWAAFIFYLSSQSWVDAPSSLRINDKVAHIILYAVFGAALAWGARGLGRRWYLILPVLGILYALSDEWHQSFVPMRDPSAGDLLADAVGILAGFLILSVVLRNRGRRGVEREPGPDAAHRHP